MTQAELQTLIDEYITTNGDNDISGGLLNSVLQAMTTLIGAGYDTMGVATPDTVPGTPATKVLYLAGAGYYTHFGTPLTVADGSICLFTYDGSNWTQNVIDVASWVNAASKLYYNTQAGSTAAKTVTAPGFTLTPGGCIKIHFDNKNTAANPTLNVNGTGAKSMIYNNAPVNATNSWKTGETVMAYYDNYGVGSWKLVSLTSTPDIINVNYVINDLTEFASAAAARTAVPAGLRKPGLQITYLLAAGWMTEQFVGTDVADWDDGDSWKVFGPSTGEFYGFYTSASNLPQGDRDGFAYVGTTSPFAIYVFKGGEWSDSGSVYELPVGNGEDIDTNDNNELQFADRVYNAQNPDGMGFVILRKDKTFAEQIADKPNTIFEIRYDFDLGASTFENPTAIPANCELRFNGGSLSNGCVMLNNTLISGVGLIDVSCAGGKLANTRVSAELFGIADNPTTAIQKAIDFIAATSGCILSIPCGDYTITDTITLKDNVILEGSGMYRTKLRQGDGISNVLLDLGLLQYGGVRGLALIGKGYNTSGITGIRIGVAGSQAGTSAYAEMISNVYVTSFNIGIETYERHWVYTIDRVIVNTCNIGIKNRCTDNMFSNIWVSNCGIGISLDNSSQNKFENIKIDRIGIDFRGEESCGLLMDDSSRNQFSNFEVQWTYSHGVIMKGYCVDNFFESLLLSVIGVNSNLENRWGIKLEGQSYRNRGNIIFDSTDVDTTLTKSISIASTASNNHLKIGGSLFGGSEIKGDYNVIEYEGGYPLGYVEKVFSASSNASNVITSGVTFDNVAANVSVEILSFNVARINFNNTQGNNVVQKSIPNFDSTHDYLISFDYCVKGAETLSIGVWDNNYQTIVYKNNLAASKTFTKAFLLMRRNSTNAQAVKLYIRTNQTDVVIIKQLSAIDLTDVIDGKCIPINFIDNIDVVKSIPWSFDKTSMQSIFAKNGLGYIKEAGLVKYIQSQEDTLVEGGDYGTHYKITGPYDLNGGTLNLPANAIIDFQGGYFTNSSNTPATINLNYAKIYPNYNALDNARKQGTINITGTPAVGTKKWDSTGKKELYWGGTDWLDADGVKPAAKYGPTSNRPAFADIYDGFKYFDTTLVMEIIAHNGTWVDTNGRTPGKHSGEASDMPKFLQGTGHIDPTANDDGYPFTFTDDATYGDKTVWWNTNAGNGGAWVDANGTVVITNP